VLAVSDVAEGFPYVIASTVTKSMPGLASNSSPSKPFCTTDKAALKKVLRRQSLRILYLDHVQTDGRLLFDEIDAMDLEGIVSKQKDSPYEVTEKPSRYRIKVKNSRYSQMEGREELFERV